MHWKPTRSFKMLSSWTTFKETAILQEWHKDFFKNSLFFFIKA